MDRKSEIAFHECNMNMISAEKFGYLDDIVRMKKEFS
jgi:hypothetical protein